MSITLGLVILFKLLHLRVTANQNLTQVIRNRTLVIKARLSSIQHILGFAKLMLSIVKLLDKLTIAFLSLTNTLAKLIDTLFQFFNPRPLRGKGCNLVNDRLEELFHLDLRRHFEGPIIGYREKGTPCEVPVAR